MQNTSEEITFEAPPTASETQEFNSTQILHDYISYLQTLTAKDSEVDDDLKKLDSLIKNKTKPASFLYFLSPKKPLTKIRENHSLWKQKDAETPSQQNNTIQSVKNSIAKTLESYREYFLARFPNDTDMISICSNFTLGGPLFQSLMDSDNVTNLNRVGAAIDAYLIKLTIMSESTEAGQSSDEIKKCLLTYPGSPNSVDHSCMDGAFQRIQNAIFGLNARSIEVRVPKNFIDKSATQLVGASTPPNNQIHLPPFLLSCLTINSQEIAKIDGSFASASTLMGLKDRISFGYNFYKGINAELSKEIEILSTKYEQLLNSPSIAIRQIDDFIESAKVSGFTIKAYNLIPESASENFNPTLQSQDLKTKKEFSDSLLTTNKNNKRIDYLRHLPNPRDLLVTKTTDGQLETTNELDIKKAEKLVDLFQSQESEPNENTRKGKIIAGLITLRNILSCHESTSFGNIFYFYLKFLKKFKEKNRVSFEDFFYDKQGDETLNFKTGVTEEEKEIIATIKSHSSAIMMKSELNEKLLLKCIQTSPEEDYEISDILKIKSWTGKNLLHYLVTIDEKEAFKKVLEIAPYLILNYAGDTDKKSLIQTLTKESDSELLSFALNYIKKLGDEYLTRVIDDHKLIYHAIENNNVDALRTIIEIAKSENKSELEIINSPLKIDETEQLTMLELALKLDYNEITRMLLEKLNQDQRPPDEAGAGVLEQTGEEALAGAGAGGRTEEEAEEDGAGMVGRTEEEAEEDGAGMVGRTEEEAEEDGAGVGVGLRAGGQAEARVEIPIQPLKTTTIQSLLEKNADCNFTDTVQLNALEIASLNHDSILEKLAELSPIARVEEAEVSLIAGTKEEIKTITPLPSPPQPPSFLSSSPSPPSSPTSTPPSQQPPLTPKTIKSPITLTSKSHPGSLSKPPRRVKPHEDASINKNLIIGGGVLIGAGAGLCVSALTVGIVFSAPVVITVIAGATIGTLAGVAIGTIVEKIQAENVAKNNSIASP